MSRALRGDERDQAIAQLVALVEAQQAEMAKLRGSLGLDPMGGQMYAATMVNRVPRPAGPG